MRFFKMFPPAKPLKAASSPIEQRPDHLAALLDPKEADLKRMTTHQLRELAASLARELKEEKTACVGLLERKQKLMDGWLLGVARFWWDKADLSTPNRRIRPAQ